jgi:SAM-dependent methyltransferase
MKKLDIDCLATIEFEVSWNSYEATHIELYLGRNVNLWRDIFPQGMKEALLGQSRGSRITLAYNPGQSVPARSDRDTITTRLSNFTRRQFLGEPVTPRLGRFYPRGMLGGVHFFVNDIRPCRITGINEKTLTADCSHPLAEKKLNISAKLEDFASKHCETGGRLTHWVDEILGTGPGMQARTDGLSTDFSSGSFQRIDEKPDHKFYHSPRFTSHIDEQANKFLAFEYSRLIKPGMEVLDLMSSVTSHLPDDLDIRVAGLGLNMEEMAANNRLDSRLVHDLNKKPELPWGDSSFDAVLCSLSVEYLTNPYQIVREALRTLRPGGILAVSFSNRWFPLKVTRLWQEMHEFERVGFVLDLMLKTGSFTALATKSVRNWWRPEHDPHINQTWISDPVYVVSAAKKPA